MNSKEYLETYLKENVRIESLRHISDYISNYEVKRIIEFGTSRVSFEGNSTIFLGLLSRENSCKFTSVDIEENNIISARDMIKNFDLDLLNYIEFICDVVESIDTINQEISKLPDVIDYLNVDVDGYPCQYVIENLDLKNKVYRCITIEHDEYRFGDIYKNAQRNVLEPLGYEIVVKNAAEDFYVKPELISEEFLKTLRSIPKDYIQCDANLHEIRKYLNF